MNEHDSETLAGMLTDMGYKESKDRKTADVIIINTCSVRENADKRFFGTLGQLKKKKEADSNFIACVCGCMMQQQHIIDTIKTKYPWVDLIFGTHNIHEFPKLINNVIREKQKLVEVWEDSGEIIEGLPTKRLFEHRAFVNVMYGCNNFCTYCIVPYTRGRERSRKPEEIIKEVKALVADGVKEITLLGQNVNSYRGRFETPIETEIIEATPRAVPETTYVSVDLGEIDSGGHMDFAELIYTLNEIDGLERIRFMTSHPKDLSDKLIQAYVDCDKLCNYIHLPVQSGSDEILRRMNRKYKKDDYLQLIKKLKAAVPEMTISTDIIVGFPGETETDFEETLDLCRQVGFDSAFTFLYSIRAGTPAEQYEDQIPEEIKHQRFNRLVDLVNESSAVRNKACEGQIYPVLVEGPSKTNSKTFTGRTAGFKPVNFQGTPDLIGQIVDVKIIIGKTFSLDGEVLDSEVQ